MPIYALNDTAPELPPEGQYWIAPSAVLIGKVRLRKNASVWFGAVLRGDNDWIEVGENSNVQDNSVIHTDPGAPTTIGADVTVGHRAIIHGATIGDGSLVGMGATILNRTKIGNGCLIGANALISEDKTFEDGSLIIGAPARAIKQISDQQRAMLKMSAQVYVQNFMRFAKGLKQIS
ncbi:MAG TPA: gamma carbonic anhydrase family protein [Rhizomicrobium sp.]|jgi:carbonic anhydrase/acetyltransferase-like protein (isoleucine patch superfamily)